MKREIEIEILMADGCTESEAIKHLEKGTTIYEDLDCYWTSYVKEWGFDSDEQEEFYNMIMTKEPIEGWGVVFFGNKWYFIGYCL